jgi:stringent starvation protein B
MATHSISNDPPAPSKQPYLLRAMHQWITDCGYTPHVIVDAGRAGSGIPKAYVKDGKIVLNLSLNATQRLEMGNDSIGFNARFGGTVHHVSFPVSAVLGIYSRETGEGMAFSATDGGPQPPAPSTGSADGASGNDNNSGGNGGGGTTPPRARPKLKVVK